MSRAQKEFAAAMGEAEYLEQRLDDQINWYDRKSAANQAAYKLQGYMGRTSPTN